MKKSDLIIIVTGVIIAACLFAALVYFATHVNTANAGLHFTM